MKPVQQTKEAPSGDVFDTQKVRRYAQIMKEFGLCELNLQDCETHISLKSAVACAPTVAPVPVQAIPAAVSPVVPAAAPAAPVEVSPAAENQNVKTIDSPIVGTFYSKPNPNSPAFVNVGDMVQEGKTVCIIEAMKVMNQLPAPISGKLLEVLVKDGDAVDVGKPLFRVEVK